MTPRSPDRVGPALRRAFLCGACFGLFALLAAQADKFNLPVDRPALGGADQAEGARILADFRRAGIAGDYWLSFELRVMPRKGAERSAKGIMVGTRGPSGPLSRVQVSGQRWLIESGPQPSAWLTQGAALQQLGPEEGAHAIAGSGVTVFELQMPFLYWRDFTYEGQARVRGRPTHSFVLRPPGDAPAPIPGLTGVRVLIDAQFQALVQADELGANGELLRSISLIDLKKVGEQWLVKAIDVRDARTRDKTRFEITGAALNLDWPLAVFTPDNLATELPAVPPGKTVRF